MENDKHDLKPGAFPTDLRWTQDGATESLERLFQFANDECKRAIDWYFTKKQSKKIAGYVFRVGAIIALAVSGMIPIIGEIYKTNNAAGISPAWATVALAIAAIFVALDRFGGYTSGWVRYIRTGQALSWLQSEFRVEWEKLRLALQAGQTDSTTLQQGIDKCKEFLAQVHSTVSAETDQWAQEFHKFLLEFEEKTKGK
jgi:hypothetical protein